MGAIEMRDGVEAGTALFANAEWQVRPDGLEHGRTGYFIERAVLDARRDDGLWAWPLHMAEKRWCAPEPFRDAFTVALRLFGIEADTALMLTFVVARGGQAGSIRDGFVRLGELVPGEAVIGTAARPEAPEPVPHAASRRRDARAPERIGA